MEEPSQETIIADCKKFQEENETLLSRAYRRKWYSPTEAGRDFCFSRNGHGTGYWDNLEGPLGEQLHKRTHSFGPQDLYEYDGKLGVE
jgi:hypothetical protein